MSYIPALLKELPEPKAVWKYFLAVTQVPRASGDQSKIRQTLRAFGALLGLEVIIDSGKNVIIRKPATPGYEHKPTVCLQAHMDMVFQKNPDVNMNSEEDPIIPRIDGEYLKATGTSLGADDGAGIAMCFAILEDESFVHGPLEVLITRDEETGLYGADALDPSVLKAEYLINIDSEEEFNICIGCAGGHSTSIRIPIARSPVAGHTQLLLHFDNFLGGHTGVDIDKGRVSPIKEAARMLSAIRAPYLLVKYEGGTADNAIAREADVVVSVPSELAREFTEAIEAQFSLVKEENKYVEHEMSLTVTPVETGLIPCDEESTKKTVQFMFLAHWGVFRMSLDTPGLVESSNVVAIIETHDEFFQCVSSTRSSVQSQLDYQYLIQKSLCDTLGIELGEKDGCYPGWKPNSSSPLLQIMKEVHAHVCGREAVVSSIHAGLECGSIQGHYPTMDCISIGPEIHHPHSPSEELLIASVPRTYQFLVESLSELAKRSD